MPDARAPRNQGQNQECAAGRAGTPEATRPGALAARQFASRTPGVRLFADEAPPRLTAEEERCKQEMYARLNPRRRKFVDRIGYDQWNPFQKPNDPLDIRTESTRRTAQQLVAEFARETGAGGRDKAYRAGVTECALGIINKDEKYQGIFDFCLWYHELLQAENHNP